MKVEDYAEIALKAAESFGRALAKPASVAYKEFVPKLKIGFSKYIVACELRFGSVKTLLYRHAPQPLHSFYVPARLRCGNETYTDKEFLMMLSKSRLSIITGIGGSGKSILLRKVFLDLLGRGGEVPLFFELRNMSARSGRRIEEYLYDSISAYLTGFSFENFVNGLRAGVFVLVLDGFDEVDFEQRNAVRNDVLRLSGAFPKAKIIISSRPNPELRSWSEFWVFEMQNLDLEEVCELIGKLNYDDVVKKKFVQAIREGLWKTHRSFLSNPLLATIMLLTFEEFAAIPDKKHVFYNQAFETLYLKHDAYKQTYTRKKYAQLPIDDFRQVLAALSAFTYVDRAVEFSRKELSDYVGNALSYSDISAEPENILLDLLESTCLMVEEGADCRFVHRSFQEYFTAVFLGQCDSGTLRKFLAKVNFQLEYDEVIGLLRSMSGDGFERYWVKPVLEHLIDQYRSVEENDVYGHIKRNGVAASVISREGDLVVMFRYADGNQEVEGAPVILSMTYNGEVNVRPVYVFGSRRDFAILNGINEGSIVASSAVTNGVGRAVEFAKKQARKKDRQGVFVVRRVRLYKKDVDWIAKTAWWKAERKVLRQYKALLPKVTARLESREKKFSEMLFSKK